VDAHNNKRITLRSLGELQAGLSQYDEATKSYSQAVAAFSKSLEIAPAQENVRRLRDKLQKTIDGQTP
jgi:hypothetical protein